MVLHERNGCLQRLLGCLTMNDLDIIAIHNTRHIIVLLHIRRSPQSQTNDEPYAYLCYNLITSAETFLVLSEYLDKIVKPTQQTKPYCGDNHQKQVDITQTAQQYHRHEYGNNDYDTPHRRHTDLVYSERVDFHMVLRQVLDEALAEPERYHQRQNQCQQRTERDVAP